MSDKTVQGVSYALLAGTGIYCLYRISDASFIFPHVTYTVITLHNVLGAWKSFSGSEISFMDITGYAQLLLALPSITTHVWSQYNYKKEFALAWIIMPAVPFVLYLLKGVIDINLDGRLVDLILAANMAALGIASGLEEEYWGVGSAVAHAISSYVVGSGQIDIYNLGLCIFTYCSLRAIGPAE